MHFLIRKFRILSLLVLLIPGRLYSQQVDTVEIDFAASRQVPKDGPTITGVIVDAATGSPLSGINIIVPEYSSAITDDAGRFTINVLSTNTTLLVSAEGFQAKEIPVKGRTELTVQLYEENYNSPYSAVYMPSAIQPKSRISNSVVSLNAENKWQSSSETPENIFQGSVPGLNMVRRSGTPGIGATMFLRGYNSLYATNQPLVLVDGMIYDMNDYGGSMINNFNSNPLMDIDVRDIENITFIKDASALYGAKAANGVILITTSHAHDLTTKMDFASYVGVNFAPRNIPVMKSDDYRVYVGDILKSQGLTDTEIQAQPYMNDDTSSPGYRRYHNETDWQDATLKNGYTSNYYFKVSGGDNISKLSLSAGYLNNTGIVDNTSLNRYNMRFNSDLVMTPKLSANFNLAFTYSEQELKDEGVAPKTNPIYLSLIKAPFLTQHEISDEGIASPNLADVDIFNISNPQQIIDAMQASNKNNRFFGSANFNYKISKHLSASTLFGVTYDKINERFFVPKRGVTPDTLSNAIAYSRSGNQIQRMLQAYNDAKLSYNRTLNDINGISASIGLRYIGNKSEVDFGKGFNSATDDLQTIGTGVNNLRQTGGTLGRWAWLNYYATLDYHLMNKYFFTANIALDGSSRFGKEIKNAVTLSDSKFATFSSVGAGWLVSSENFMANIRFIEMLKLRVSYGTSGNDDIGNYTSKQTYVSQNLLGMQGIVTGNVGNSSIQWETVRKLNAGIDLSLFEERLSLSVDIYQNKTSNMLVYEQTPTLTGLGDMLTNNGAMENTGIELALNTRILKGPFKWDLGFNVMTYKNKVTQIPNGSMTTSFAGATMLTQVGSPLALFYGYKTNGVYSSDDEATNEGKSIQLGNGDLIPFMGGDVRFVDMDGNGIIDEGDRTVIGDPNPDFSGLLSNRFQWKKFSLDAYFTFSSGNSVYDYTLSRLESVSGIENQTLHAVSRWRTDGQVTDVPKATWGDPMGNSRFSDRWIEDGSYIRLRTLSLSYNLSIKSERIKYSTIYLTGNNLFTATKYLGYDPEFSASNSPLSQGINSGQVPQFTSILVGVRLGL